MSSEVWQTSISCMQTVLK